MRKSTKYTFVVQAFNSEGAGPYSNEIFANTFNNGMFKIEFIKLFNYFNFFRLCLDPPKPIHVKLESIAHHNATIGWKKSSDQIQGFILNYKQILNNELDQFGGNQESTNQDNWETIKLPKFYRRYTLTNLNCGTRYLVHLIVFNEIGESELSNELNFSTKGSLPIAPSRVSFIQPNITSALLYLTAWKDSECPLSHFIIQYRQKNDIQWRFHSTIQVTYNNGLQPNSLLQNNAYQSPAYRTEYHITSTNELPFQKSSIYQSSTSANNNNLVQQQQATPFLTMASTYGQLVLNDLQAGTWHELQIESFNQAGKTSTSYMFATKQENGATVSPLILDDQLNISINNSDFYLNYLYQYSSFTFLIILSTLFVIILVYVIYIRAKLQRQSTIDQCKKLLLLILFGCFSDILMFILMYFLVSSCLSKLLILFY